MQRTLIKHTAMLCVNSDYLGLFNDFSVSMAGHLESSILFS
jgi:hypothetical protein